MKEPFILLLSISCMIHVQICAGRYNVPVMPGSLSGQDWSRNPGYNCHNGGAQFQQFSSYPYSSTRYDHDFEYQHNICCPGNPGIPSGSDHAFGMPRWPANPTSKSPWSWQYASDPYWLYQYYGFSNSPGSFPAKPGYGAGSLDNGWKDYGSCNDEIHTATANCKAEETESCNKQMETMEQRFRAHCTKAIKEKCNNQSSQPQYWGDCKESYRKEKASLEERLQGQCATAQLNAATKCKNDQDTMSEEHRKANKQLEQEKERLKKQNDERAQKAKDDQKAKEKLEQENEELEKENKLLKKQNDERAQKSKDDQKAKEKLEQDNEELEQENKKLKKQDDERAQKAKDDQKAKEKLEQENEELEKENKKLKKQNDERAQKSKDDQKAKEKLEQENEELEKENKLLKKQNDERAQKSKDDQKAKEKLEQDNEELEQENKKLKKQDDERAQKANDDQKAKEKLEKENEKLKAETRPEQQPNKKASQPDSSRSELEAFSKKECPALHNQRATVLGVTYEAFCGARPRGRDNKDYIDSSNLEDCMGACTVDRSCQGIYYQSNYKTCYLTIDYNYPPTGSADSNDFSLIPVVPREGGIGTTAPDLPSRLLRAGQWDNDANCPDSDGMIVSIGSLQFRLNCKKYSPKKTLEKTGTAPNANGLLAICALNPACQGVAHNGVTNQMIAEHEQMPEKTKNSEIEKAYHWVLMLTEPRVVPT